MRKIILFCAALLMAHASMGQQREYNDLYKSLGSMKNPEAYRALFQYLQKTTSKDFANPSAYYQLGLVMQRFIKESDPFLNTKSLQEYLEQANVYFSLSKMALTNNNFRQYTDFFPEITPEGQKLTIEDVKKDIDKRLADMEEFTVHLNESLSCLVKSVNFYNYCITVFGEINQENSRLNDLYFLIDEPLSDKLNELGANFDSTLFYLDKLKASLEKYPLSNYKINYSLKQIPVYRLYGLNSSSFISENVTLWDFRTWVNNFHEIMNTDVAFLYGNAQAANSTNTAYIARLLNMDSQDIPPQYKLNPLIINKMLKYDFNSATAALLSYQEAKVNYLYSIVDNRIDNDLASFDRFSKSPEVFLTAVVAKQKTDELLTEAKAKATPESINKYAKFYQGNYRGFSGYEKYLSSEADENEAVLRNALNNYKDLILKSHIRTGAEKTVDYKGKPIVFLITAPALLGSTEGYYIHSKSQFTNNEMLIAGTNVTENQKNAFVALTDSLGVVIWLKEFKQAKADSHAMLTEILNEGLAVIVSSPDGNAVKNRLLLLDPANGNTRTTKDLLFSSVPQQLVYDDIAQTFVLSFKGNTFMPYSASGDPLLIAMLDARLETVWVKTLAFDGYVANVIKTDDNYYVYGTFRKLTDEAGRQYATRENQMNMFVYPVNADGNWLNVNVFEAPFSYFPLNVVKINNEYVDVISLKEAQPDQLIESRALGGNPYYMVIQSNSDVIYQYIQ